MANFSAGSGEMLTLSLFSIVPATMLHVLTWIVYIALAKKEKYRDKAEKVLTVSRIVGTILCGIAAIGAGFFSAIAAFSYFNVYWALVVVFLAAVNPTVAYFLSLTLGCRYCKKHASSPFTKPLKVVISWFVGMVLLGELLLGVIILLFS